MANAAIDSNSNGTLIGALNTDGETVIRVCADPTTHGLCVDDGTTGSDNGNNDGNALTDENGRKSITALASDGSGDIVIVYVTSDNKLMIDSA